MWYRVGGGCEISDDGRTLWPKHVVEFTSSKLIYHPVLSCV